MEAPLLDDRSIIEAPPPGPPRPREEGMMVGKDRWEEIRRLYSGGVPVTEIARRLDLDRKTVRRWVRQADWRPYRRAAKAETLLCGFRSSVNTSIART